MSPSLNNEKNLIYTQGKYSQSIKAETILDHVCYHLSH